MQVPPSDPGSPPPYAAYPRGRGSDAGTAEQLEALRDGYYGLNRAGLITFALVVGLNVAVISSAAETRLLMFGIGYPIVMVIVALSSYPFNKKIAYGASWAPSSAILASVGTALFACFCYGLLGLIVMQTIAASQIKKFGIKSGAFGLKKDVINQRIAEIRSAEASPGPMA